MTEGRVLAICFALLGIIGASLAIGESVGKQELYGGIGVIVAALILLAIALFGPEWHD